MTREPVESSPIRAIGYDVPSSILEVELVDDGTVYEYFDVPISAYLELMEAESKGEYFNEFIKDLYAFRRVAEVPPRGGPPGPIVLSGMTTQVSPASRPRASSPSPSTGVADRTHALAREIAIYRSRKPEFLEEHEGQFVLIHGEDVVGFFPSREDALESGFDRFGPVEPMLVHQVLRVEPILSFSRGI